MRVLVCGSRHWRDAGIMHDVLDGIAQHHAIVLIQGGQRTWDPVARTHHGADYLASLWAQTEAAGHLAFPADWAKHGKGAGPIRNQRMLDEGRPDIVVAFKDGFRSDIPDDVIIGDAHTVRRPSGGTEDMVRRAKAAGIPVYIVSHG